jgi:hypothetical protein
MAVQAQDAGAEDGSDLLETLFSSQIRGVGGVVAEGHRHLLREAMPATTFAWRPVCCLATKDDRDQRDVDPVICYLPGSRMKWLESADYFLLAQRMAAGEASMQIWFATAANQRNAGGSLVTIRICEGITSRISSTIGPDHAHPPTENDFGLYCRAVILLVQCQKSRKFVPIAESFDPR